MTTNKRRMELAHKITKMIMCHEAVKTSYRENLSMVLVELHKLNDDELAMWWGKFKAVIRRRILQFFEEILGFDFEIYQKNQDKAKREMKKQQNSKATKQSTKTYSLRYFEAKYAGRDIETGEYFEAGELIFRNGNGYSLASNY